KLPPHFVGRMIPRPAHIQGQLRQGIESFDFRGQETVDRVADTRWLAHGFDSEVIANWIFACIRWGSLHCATLPWLRSPFADEESAARCLCPVRVAKR